ncbi:MAG: MaoC family dehydratase [Bacilli bacterium]|nr:MaoC family dehydratase [Bacilli bacterium]
MLQSLTMDEIYIGQEATFTKKITLEDVESFATITEDRNPAHMDEEYAQATIFKKRIAHGMLVGSLFSTIFGVMLPGLGSIYTKQSLKFIRPVFFDDVVTAKVMVKEKNVDKNRVVFDCAATNQKGEVVVVGEAEIMPPAQEVSQ